MPFAIFLPEQGLLLIVQYCLYMCLYVCVIAKFITDMKADKKIRDHKNQLKMIPDTCQFKCENI